MLITFFHILVFIFLIVFFWIACIKNICLEIISTNRILHTHKKKIIITCTSPNLTTLGCRRSCAGSGVRTRELNIHCSVMTRVRDWYLSCHEWETRHLWDYYIYIFLMNIIIFYTPTNYIYILKGNKLNSMMPKKGMGYPYAEPVFLVSFASAPKVLARYAWADLFHIRPIILNYLLSCMLHHLYIVLSLTYLCILNIIRYIFFSPSVQRLWKSACIRPCVWRYLLFTQNEATSLSRSLRRFKCKSCMYLRN